MRFFSLSILTRVQGTVSPVAAELSVGSRFANGVMAWMDGLVLPGGATDAGWLPPGCCPPALHDIRPKKATTATSIEAALCVVVVFGRWQLAAHGGRGGNLPWDFMSLLFSCLLALSGKSEIRPRIVVLLRFDRRPKLKFRYRFLKLGTWLAMSSLRFLYFR